MRERTVKRNGRNVKKAKSKAASGKTPNKVCHATPWLAIILGAVWVVAILLATGIIGGL